MSALSETAVFLREHGAVVELKRDDDDGTGFLSASLGEREAAVTIYLEDDQAVTAAWGGPGPTVVPTDDFAELRASNPRPCGELVLLLLEGPS